MDDDADRLYGLPLAEFVPGRTALAKRLRADGRRDDAAAVAKLPKPTVAAWAANQVLRSQPSDARALFAAGDALAAADRTTLRDAIAEHREVLGRLMAAARGLLDPDGRSLSAATTEKVMQTLNAASLDPDLRDEAGAARLVKEHTFSGLGLRPAPKGAPAPPPATRGRRTVPVRDETPPEPQGPDPKKLKAARRRVEKAEAELAKARAALDDLGAA